MSRSHYPVQSMLLACLLGGAQLCNAELKIHGGNSELRQNIEAHLHALVLEPCERSLPELAHYKKDLNKNINAAAQALGYYQLHNENVWSQQNCWQLDITIKAGPETRIHTFDIELSGAGRDDTKLSTLVETVSLKSGQVLNHSVYDASKRQLMKKLQQHGYWQGHWDKHQLQIHPEKQQANINWQMNTGPQSYFGELLLPQLGFKNDFLIRLAGLPTGQSYDKAELDRAYRRLQNSNYFSTVWLQPHFEPTDFDGKLTAQKSSAAHTNEPQPNQYIVTQFDAELASQYQFSAGIGYATDQGVRLSSRLENKYVNSDGHSWNLDALWSEKISGTAFNYRIPLLDPADQWLNNQVSYDSEETDSYNRETYNTGVRYVEHLNDKWQWFTAINLQREFYQLNQQDDKVSDLLMPSIGASFLALDDPNHPTLGLRIETELLGSSKDLVSDVDFFQAKIKAKFILPLSSRTRLITRGQVGSTLNDDFDELPPSIRFYTGGDSSVRGYDYNSIGEVDSSGETQGGSQLLVASVEIDQHLWQQWSGAIFFDMGSAYDSKADFKRGAGLGVRWQSPVGPLRVDLAHPLDDEKSNYAIHLSLGTDL